MGRVSLPVAGGEELRPCLLERARLGPLSTAKNI